jgi:hypothetical protein
MISRGILPTQCSLCGQDLPETEESEVCLVCGEEWSSVQDHYVWEVETEERSDGQTVVRPVLRCVHLKGSVND